MKARERLEHASTCIADGRYEEALLELVWFHDHALEENPSLYGVRRSYALAYWVRLGEVYPPALAALQATRDGKAAALLAGELDKSVFRDVAAIDQYLDAVPATYSLYLELLAKQPEVAAACGRNALSSVVAAGDFALAARLAPDAQSAILRRSAELNLDVHLMKYQPYTRAPRRWAYVGIYVDGIQELLKIKTGNGEHAEAARLKALAIDRIQSPSLRREVQADFVKKARAPAPWR